MNSLFFLLIAAFLRLYNNRLTGAIPSEIGLMENLSELFALFGTHIEVTFSLYELLTHILVHHDYMTMTFLLKMNSLLLFIAGSLRLDINQLTGTIPSEIGLMENLGELFALL